ncbi:MULTISPECIES: hypothetical protein [Oligella]|uniref:Uncharacterized protein n=1 Tax=Oligella urethralis TaxID=90245 RepID=A0A2X1ULM4_9BURK|nr:MULTISPECIES: hypothetical protein [Oligella]OFV49710.1 hypothetical protein HMPREF3179_03625 [Oligella sp. HMSC09E12]SPY08038.1 Uncharacterised protein [Oligella urethralis]
MRITIDEHLLGLENNQGINLDGLENLTEEELLDLHNAVLSFLPTSHLNDLDLEQELVLQFRRAQHLQDSVLNRPDIPANQQAQVLNSVASTLQQLVKMQSEYYTFERFKKIEGLLVNMVNQLPDEQAREFIRKYEEELVK